jgi:DNA-binding GntR family transcriptional regulator
LVEAPLLQESKKMDRKSAVKLVSAQPSRQTNSRQVKRKEIPLRVAESGTKASGRPAISGSKTRKPRGTGAAFVYERLRDEILSLELKPGSPLDEVGLSKRFKLSRSPVREAIIRLASEGLVTVFPNRSSMVAPLDIRLIPCHLDALEIMQRLTTRLAAQNRTEANIARIKTAETAFADAVNQRLLLQMINANYDYHMAIAEAGGNPYFTSLYGRLLDEGKRMLHMHFSFAAESRLRGLETLLSEHAAITEAVQNGDMDLAEELAYVHSVEFRKRFTSYLEQNSAAADFRPEPQFRRARSSAKPKKQSNSLRDDSD